MNRLLLGPVVALLLTASVQAADPASAAEVAELVKGNNAFAFDLYARLRDQPGNLFLIDLEQGRIVDDGEIKHTISTQQPYRALFQALRSGGGREPGELAEAEREAAADSRALGTYRAGRSCHPLLPFAEWSACQPAIGRLGAVLIAGCRDATTARRSPGA